MDGVIRADWSATIANENAFRLYLASSLGEGAASRPANRVRWLTTALEPGCAQKLGKKRFDLGLSACHQPVHRYRSARGAA